MFFLVILSFIICPSLAQAHVIEGVGLTDGLVHPLSGIDHLLAMVAVGIIGVRFGAPTMFLVPVIFLISMCLGIFCGVPTIPPQIVEVGICGSLLFFGAILFAFKKTSLLWTICGVALFAFFHGHSHGEEVFLLQHAATYYSGLIIATALLHLCGIALGVYGKNHLGFERALRYSGAATFVVGLYLMIPNLGM